MRLGQNITIKTREHGSAPAKKTRGSLMWSLMIRLLICCAFLIGAVTSAQASPLGMFQMLEHSVECLAKSGTDSLTCASQRVPANPDLFPSIDVYDATATDPEMDFVWSHVQSFDVTLELNPKFQECEREGESDNNVYDDVRYDLSKRDLNDDEYQDYLVAISCYSDVYYQDKMVSREYGADHWVEPFLAMFCGSEEGIYNCTEELTGHKDVIGVGGDVLPGFILHNQVILVDLNDDGIKDAIVPQSRDFSRGSAFHEGDEWMDAYFDLMGMTRQEVIDICGDDICWVQRSQQAYAVSGPDGVWEIHQFDIPKIWEQGGGSTELYLKDGEYHVNFKMWDNIGYTNWHVFNAETNKFDFVAQGHKEEPWDVSQNWNEHRVQYRTFWGGEESAWKQIGDNEYRVELNDPNLSNVSDARCQDFFERNYEDCQFDQLHILARDRSGKITKVTEYKLADWADDKRKVSTIPNSNDLSYVQPWNQYQAMSYDLHGHWVYARNGRHTQATIQQLETKTDAPWYLIVTVEGRNDLRDPGSEYVPEVINDCHASGLIRDGIVDSDDYRCWSLPSSIAFKYLIDFESNTLSYAGTLLEEEYPFMWIAFDGSGPGTWAWKDRNNDGWYDVSMQAGDNKFAFVSDGQGIYRYLDLGQVTPLMPYGRASNPEESVDTMYDGNTKEWVDTTGDGVTDFFATVNGTNLTYALENWRTDYDPRLNDLYEPDRIYLDIVNGGYEVFSEADVLNHIDLQKRVSECIDRVLNGTMTLYQAGRCYNLPWQN